MNAWNCFIEFFTSIWEVLAGSWDFAVGATWDNARIRRFIRGALISFGVCVAIMILGFLFKLKVLVVVASALAAIIAFAAGKVLRIIVKVLIKLVALGESASKTAVERVVGVPILGWIVSPVGDVANWTATELSNALQEVLKSVKNSLSFIVTVSMTLAFIGALTAIRGVGYYSLNDLMVIGAAVLFTSLFFVYINKKVKTVGYIMYGVWIYFFIGGWLFPIQVQGTLDWLESKTIRRAVVATDSNWKGQLVVIPARTPLYHERFGSFAFTGRMTDREVEARVIGRKNDPDSKEPMYKVKLPLSGFNSLYVGGATHFVPASLVRPAQSQPPLQADWPSRSKVKLGIGEHKFVLSPGEQTPWLELAGGTLGNIYTPDKADFTIYFDDGDHYTVRDGEFKSGPKKELATFKITANNNLQRFTVTVKPLAENNKTI